MSRPAACGGLVHPQLPPDEVTALGERFGVVLRHGTVNFGLPLLTTFVAQPG